MCSSSTSPRWYRQIVPFVVLLVIALTALPTTTPTAQSATLAATLPPGLTYTAGGELYALNLTDGTSVDAGTAPRKEAVINAQGQVFWIESSDRSNWPYPFTIMRSEYDGSNPTAILTSNAFYSLFPKYNEPPNTLEINTDQTQLFFNPCIGTDFSLSCSMFSLNMATKRITNLQYSAGWHIASIAPDGSRAIGGAKSYYPGGGGSTFPTYLFSKNNPSVQLSYASDSDAIWLADGRIIYSLVVNDWGWPPEAATEAKRIILADAKGSTLQELATGIEAYDLVLSADQQQFAYIVKASDTTSLWLMNIDGTGNRKIADLPKDAGELRWIAACANPPSTELINQVDQLASKSNAYIDQVLATSKQAAIDGDYFAAQAQVDKNKLIADTIVDSLGLLGDVKVLKDINKAVKQTKDMTKEAMPGVLGRGWGHILRLKGSSEAARDAFAESLKQPVTAANARIAGKALLSDAYKYYAADMLDERAENLLTEQMIAQGFMQGLQGDLALQSRMYPRLEQLSNDFKQDITQTAKNAPIIFPCMDTAQQALYATDLKKRKAANAVMYTTLGQRAAPLRNAHIARESPDDGWLQMFLAKYFLKTTATIAFDGPGTIAVDSLSAGWNLYKNVEKLNEDTKMMHIGVNTLGGALSTQKAMYLNTVHGIDNIALGSQPQIPDVRVNSIVHKSIYDAQAFGQQIWWERRSFSEISLSNTSMIDTRYQIIAGYGNTGIQGRTYQPLVAEATIHIPANGTAVIQVPYKDDQGGNSVSPDKDSTININILGSTDTGVYWLLNTATAWQPSYSTGGGIAAVTPQATFQDTPLILPYPIRSQIAISEENLTYTHHLWVDNPFSYPIHVQVTQLIPTGVQVVDAQGGTVANNTISWSQNIAPQTTVDLRYTISYAGPSDTLVTYPAAQLTMTDTAAHSASFISDPAQFQSVTPLVGEGTPVAHILTNQIVNIPFSITNRSASESAGTVHLTVTDMNGVQVSAKTQDVIVPTTDKAALSLALQGLGTPGTYILTASVDSNGGSDQIFAFYLEVARPIVYLPAIRR